MAEAPAAEPDAGTESEVTVEQALAFGLELIGRQELGSAATLFRRILEVAPEHPDALNFLGIATYHLGHRMEGVALVRQAAALMPRHAGIRNNLGNMLVEAGDIDGAVDAYRRSVELDPSRPEPLNNLASILKARRDYAGAEPLLRQALSLDAAHGAAHHNLGEVLLSTGRPEEALDHFWKACALIGSRDFSPYGIALAYERAGHREIAVRVLEDWLRQEPDNVQLGHLLSAFTGEAVPPRAADAYVEAVFDGFADAFDARLAELEYRAPALVGAALAAVLGAPSGNLAILDAGCGTGLCGPHLRPYAGQLRGVDLSAGMLERAAATGLYDELAKDELTAFLAGRRAAYDAVVSADTLCYFGALEPFAAAAAQALRPGGILVFTVEALDPPAGDYRLDVTGRYAHCGPYLDRVFGDAGFEVLARREETLRIANRAPVAGFVFSARRP
jgi:predicted TPR repeat methyltransferase